jgi:hypothetical protein
MSNEKVNNAAIDHTFLMTSGKTDELTDSECHDIVILMAKIVTKTIFMMHAQNYGMFRTLCENSLLNESACIENPSSLVISKTR